MFCARCPLRPAPWPSGEELGDVDGLLGLLRRLLATRSHLLLLHPQLLLLLRPLLLLLLEDLKQHRTLLVWRHGQQLLLHLRGQRRVDGRELLLHGSLLLHLGGIGLDRSGRGGGGGRLLRLLLLDALGIQLLDVLQLLLRGQLRKLLLHLRWQTGNELLHDHLQTTGAGRGAQQGL